MEFFARRLAGVGLATAVAALAAGCAAPQSQTAEGAGQQRSVPVANWSWSKAEIVDQLNAGKIAPARANKTLAVDGDYCASQANTAPVPSPVEQCESKFVFECDAAPEAPLSGCTATVRGATCNTDQLSNVWNAQQPVFESCMAEVGWQPVQ